ncbi:hypothetical protein, partial [Eggerthella lenta]|uniref:hypothetical protein n=1 Tax=Eggerthella lenta TaxID=84112 RepID=UPI001E41CEC1
LCPLSLGCTYGLLTGPNGPTIRPHPLVLLIEFQERAAKAGETAASNRNKNGTEDRRENG